MAGLSAARAVGPSRVPYPVTLTSSDARRDGATVDASDFSEEARAYPRRHVRRRRGRAAAAAAAGAGASSNGLLLAGAAAAATGAAATAAAARAFASSTAF